MTTKEQAERIIKVRNEANEYGTTIINILIEKQYEPAAALEALLRAYVSVCLDCKINKGYALALAGEEYDLMEGHRDEEEHNQ